jgi:hypothetical protein
LERTSRGKALAGLNIQNVEILEGRMVTPESFLGQFCPVKSAGFESF